jgi:hypothetical protein
MPGHRFTIAIGAVVAATFSVNAAAQPPDISSLTANVAFPVSWGTQITWTATASGGTAPLQYQFWRLRQGVGWTLAQDYSTNNTLTWTPSVFDGGTYSLQVFVRSSASSSAFEAWRSFDNFVIVGAPPLTVTSFTANVSFPSHVFVPITWTATASVAGSFLYQFWRLRQGVGWTMVQDYSTYNTFSWTPVEADAGTYVLQVWVKSSISPALDAWSITAAFEISPPGPVQITSLNSSVVLPAVVGTPITWSATATGGSPPVQFKFLLRDAAGVWSVLQDYSPVSRVPWTPTVAGDYVLQVWARSTGSAAALEDWRGTETFTVNPSTVPVVSSLTTDAGLPAISTNSMTWTAIAAGGIASLEYEFWRFRQGSGWTLAQAYSPSPTYVWAPAPGEEGTYHLQVWVRSAGSTAPFEAWLNAAGFQVVPPTVFRLQGQSGDFIIGAGERLFTSADASFAPFPFANAAALQVTSSSNSSVSWQTFFSPPAGVPFVPGVYSDALAPSQGTTAPKMFVHTLNFLCTLLWGRFVVLEVSFDSSGVVDHYAADFEQHCHGNAGALFGSIRFKSTVPLVPIRDVALEGTLPGHIDVPLVWTIPDASADREYQFWRYSQATHKWLLLQSYSTNPTVIWTPQPGDEGSWAIEVWERASGSVAAYDTWRSSGAFSVGP